MSQKAIIQPTPSPEKLQYSFIKHALMGYAQKLDDNTLCLSELASLYEEIELYRKHIKQTQGELSLTFQLSTSLLTLSKLASHEEPCEKNIQHWIAKYKIALELFSRIISSLNTLREQQSTQNHKMG